MNFYFEEAGLWEGKKREVFRQINDRGLPLILFGKAAAVPKKSLEPIAVPIRYICDNDPQKWGTYLWGLKVISPADIKDIYPAYNALILVPFERQIIPQLQGLPVPPENIFQLDLYFETGDTLGYFQKVRPRLEKIYDSLCDRESRDTYEAVIRYRINRSPGILSPIALPRESQYFPQSLDKAPFLSGEEHFVDAGAFIGDTVQRFCGAVRGRYGSIHAFEPDAGNYKVLLRSTGDFHDLTCVQTAVSDKRETIRFFSDDSGSKADPAGEEAVTADTLDHLLEGSPVSYLKMDVEGMECAALRGAKKLIQSCHPKLAICTYHSDADMVEVPELILDLDPSYRLYFRHYTNALVETVCYAV